MQKTRVDKIKKEDSIEGEIVQTQWDFKKIAIGFVIFALLVIVGAYIFFPSGESVPQSTTLGVSSETQDSPPLPDKDDVESIISEAQSTLSEITAGNVTSSDSAIQKIIADLESIKGNASAKGAICSLICKE